MEAPMLVDPKNISFDKKNPRGETEEEIKDDTEYQTLVESVKDNDVWVPLIVKDNKSASDKPYILVDGERRLRAALDCKKSLVPVNIIKSDDLENRSLAFQIHMLRKQWSVPAQVRALKEIRDQLVKHNKDITEKGINRHLRKHTSYKQSQLSYLLPLMKYADGSIKRVEEEGLSHSYLIQIESSFISPLKREFPEIYKEYGEKRLHKILIQKALDGKLVKTRYLMENFLQLFRLKDRKNILSRQIKKFLNKRDEDIVELVEKVKSVRIKAKKKSTTRRARKKKKDMEDTEIPEPVNLREKLISHEREIIGSHVFDLIFNYLRESIMEFEKRMDFRFKDEIELQHFIYAILRSLFLSTEFEDPTEKKVGKSAKPDFVIKDFKIIIEVKYVRDRKHAKKIYDELAIDLPKYKRSKYGNTIINYIYDPGKNIVNHEQYKRELKELLEDAHYYIQ